MSLQDSEKHAAQQHADRTANIAPTPESIRGPRILKHEATKGHFYQAVFPEGNVYYVQAQGNGNFKVISQERVVNRDWLTKVGAVMTVFDSDERMSGKLYKFTQRRQDAHPEMKTYPRGKSAKDIGAKVGDQFIVVEPGTFDRVGDIVTLTLDDGSSCPFFKSAKRDNLCISWHRLAPLVPAAPAPEPEPVKPIPEALQIGDRVRYTEKSGLGIKRLVGELGTVTDRYSAGAVEVAWDCGYVAKGHGHSVEYLEKVAEPVKPKSAALKVGDRVVYDFTKHPSGDPDLHGVYGTVTSVNLGADPVFSTIHVQWDNGKFGGHSSVCVLPLVEQPMTTADTHKELETEPVSAADAQDLMAWDETYALPAQPVDPVTACKQRIDAAKAEIERLASEQRVADKVLRDAQDDLLKELKGYLPEQPVSHPSVDIQTYLNKHPGAGVGGSGIVRSPLGGF